MFALTVIIIAIVFGVVLARFNERLRAIETYLASLKQSDAVPAPIAPSATPPVPTSPPAAHAVSSTPKTTTAPQLGERALAISGGAFLVIGIVFFLALAITNGWITHATQIGIAYVGGALMIGLGWLLRSRHPQGAPIASTVLVGVGAGVVELGAVVGVQVYENVSMPLGFASVVAASCVAVTGALRWSSLPLATFGIVTGLAAPILVDAPADVTTMVLVAVLLLASLSMSALRNWPWLITASIAVTAPQLQQWTNASGTSINAGVFVVSAWWLAIAVASLAWHMQSITREQVEWTTSSERSIKSGIQLATASTTGASLLAYAFDSLSAGLAFCAVHAVFCLVVASAWRTKVVQPVTIMLGLGAGIAAVLLGAYEHYTWSLVTLCATGVALITISTLLNQALARVAAWAFMAASALLVLTWFALPDALLFGVHDLAYSARGIIIFLTSCVAVIVVCRSLGGRAIDRQSSIIATGTSLIYLASVAVVDRLTPTSARTTLDTSSKAQLALSLMWATCGLALLAFGVRRSMAGIRIAGFALFGIVAAKVLLVDTSNLDSGYRVLSFLIVGALLLLGAFVNARVSGTDDR